MRYYRNDEIPFNCYGMFVKEVIMKCKRKKDCVPSLNDISNMWSELSQSKIMNYKRKYEMLVKKKEEYLKRQKKTMKSKEIINEDNNEIHSHKECHIEKKGGMMYCYNKELENAISQSISNMQRVKSYSKTIINKHKHISKIINENDDKSTDISFSNNIITQTHPNKKRAKSYIKTNQENTLNTPHNSNNNSDNENNNDNDIDYTIHHKPSNKNKSKQHRKKLLTNRNRHLSRSKKKKLCRCGDCDKCKNK